MRVKRTICRACGAPKITRPTTGYVYCDFCAVLTDWDIEIAKSAPGAVIPHAYEELTKELAPALAKAKKANDRAQYHELQAKLYDAYATLCPAGFSPRIKDPEYRKRFVEYTAATCVVQDFDPDFPALSDAVTAGMAGLQWDMHQGTARVKPHTFWPMWKAYVARMNKSMELNESSGLIAQQPDGAPTALLRAMGLSAMVQAWLAYLDEESAAKLLAESGLAGDYVEATKVDTDARTCGGCGAHLHVAKGAKHVMCEACGQVVDVANKEAPCAHCGKPSSWPIGKTMSTCPSCKMEQRAMVNPYG